MTSEEIRKRFIDYFLSKGHAQVRSSSLLPNDPSVLLTTAGMQQFKPYFTGELDAQKDFGSKSTASIQKSFRTSDIEETGDNTHLTFFEMLGNFSFGGYWKKEAITFAYELFTKELDMPISYVTIFKGSEVVPKDEESRQIWQSLGVTDVREEGMNDVFWGPTGQSGPCGPTTEIYCKNGEGKDVEVWNIVFNQFFYPGSRDELLKGASGKTLSKLPVQGIDTGAGLERVVMTKQGVPSVYQTDLFTGIMMKLHGLAPAASERVRRIIADHVRASVFLIADGVRPSNKDAGYVLRRLIRRILAHKIKEDIHGDIFAVVVPAVQEKFAAIYPELNNPEILHVLHDEQGKFEKAIATGLVELRNPSIAGASIVSMQMDTKPSAINGRAQVGSWSIVITNSPVILKEIHFDSVIDVFKSDNLELFIDGKLVKVVLEKRKNLVVVNKDRTILRLEEIIPTGSHLVTLFLKGEKSIIYPTLIDAEAVDKTYGIRVIVSINNVNQTKLSSEYIFHIASTFGLNFELMKEMEPETIKNVSIHDFEKQFKKHQELSRAGQEKKFGGHGLLLDTGELKAKDEVELVKVTRLHTATHLLQAALRKVLGNEVRQAGSDITAERTRFDFTFSRKLTPEEIKKTEETVNWAIEQDLPVSFVEMDKREAEKTGALFFFKAKYADRVKVYVMGHSIDDCFSKEFCGGPHVNHTAEVGKFKIVKEEAVAAGVRRIRGVVD